MKKGILILAGLVLLMVGSQGSAQIRLTKAGVAGSSTIRVQCQDAFVGAWPDELDSLVRRFKSDIIVRCVATAASGSGVIQSTDFSWHYKYGTDSTVRRLSNINASGDWGQMYGSIERTFYLAFPSTPRPEVIILKLGNDEGTVVFSTYP